jgi:hypothetical protein
MPLAISTLRYLQELHFDHNTHVGDYGVRVPLLRGFLLYLNQLSLKDDNITTFPEVLKSFDRLEIVNIIKPLRAWLEIYKIGLLSSFIVRS